MSDPSGPFAPITLIGGWGGHSFSSCGWVQGSSALVVKRLDVWYSSDYLRGIQITYSDESRTTAYGNASDNLSAIDLKPGELVTSMTLWGNGIGTRTGRIRLTTNKDQILDVGKDTSGQTAYDIDVGAGILVGMMGRNGIDIDQLGAIFLRSAVEHVAITDVVYSPDLAGTDQGIQDVALDEAHYSNDATATKQMTWNFGGKKSRTTSTTYSQTTGNTYAVSASVEVSAKPFGIGVKATGGFQWQHQSQQTTATTVLDALDLTWNTSGKLDPGESTTCTALVQYGHGRTNYTSKVTVKLEDGSTNTFEERGRFQKIAYTKVSVTSKKAASIKELAVL